MPSLPTVVEWSRGRAERVVLGVADDNAAAVRLYERSRFVATGQTEPFPDRVGVLVLSYASSFSTAWRAGALPAVRFETVAVLYLIVCRYTERVAKVRK